MNKRATAVAMVGLVVLSTLAFPMGAFAALPSGQSDVTKTDSANPGGTVEVANVSFSTSGNVSKVVANLSAGSESVDVEDADFSSVSVTLLNSTTGVVNSGSNTSLANGEATVSFGSNQTFVDRVVVNATSKSSSDGATIDASVSWEDAGGTSSSFSDTNNKQTINILVAHSPVDQTSSDSAAPGGTVEIADVTFTAGNVSKVITDLNAGSASVDVQDSEFSSVNVTLRNASGSVVNTGSNTSLANGEATIDFGSNQPNITRVIVTATSKSDSDGATIDASLRVEDSIGRFSAVADTQNTQTIGQTLADKTIDTTTTETFWQGQSLLLKNSSISSEEVVDLREDGTDDLVRQIVAESSGNVIIETDSLEGTYYIEEADSNTRIATFEVAAQAFSAAFADGEVATGGTETLDIDSNRGSFNVTVDAAGLTDSELVDIFSEVGAFENDDGDVEMEVNGGGSVTANFTDISTGDYTFELEVTDANASASASLTVREEDEGRTFAQSVYEEEVGDVATFTVQLQDTDAAWVVVGDEASGWIGAVHVEDEDDDGEVVVTFNSYMAGQSGDLSDVFSAGPDDAIGEGGYANVTEMNSSWGLDGPNFDAETNLTEPIEGGDYSLRTASSADMSEGGDLDNENDVATLILGERSTDSATVWTAPAADSDADDAEELLAAVTEDDTITLNDRLVVEVQATGIYGYLDTRDDALVNLSSGSSEPITLTLTQTNPGANRDPAQIRLTETDTDATVLLDSDNDRLFLVIDTRNVNATLRDLANGQTWEATFTVGNESSATDNYGNYVEGETAESVSATFSLESADGELDNLNADDELQVLQDSAATVSGTTNLAPGSELNVRLRASGDSPFLKTAIVTVAEDGTWSAEFDMSDVAVGQEFTAQVRAGQTVIISDTDGIVVEEISAGTPAPRTVVETRMVQSPTPVVEERTVVQERTIVQTVQVTPTSTPGQPGFGIAVAIVALLAAALLAVRRRD